MIVNGNDLAFSRVKTESASVFSSTRSLLFEAYRRCYKDRALEVDDTTHGDLYKTEAADFDGKGVP